MQLEAFQDFCNKISVRDDVELYEKLELYEALLVKWQKAINLVAPSTLPHIWHRHILDSLQLVPFLPEGCKTIVDIGSGAGFPALVLAIARPYIQVTCIESDLKKAQFLQNVSRETNANLTVLNERIERVQLGTAPDLVTARALSSLDQLCAYMQGLGAVRGLFLKGENVEQEIERARTLYSFEHKCHASETSKSGKLLFLSNLRPCG
tara:strand:+ start:927 stop:1550 length:624 start_codon:yes stop_codon:yes gene_type:complete